MSARNLIAGTAMALCLACGAASAAPIYGSVAVNTTAVSNNADPLSSGDVFTLVGATFGLGTPLLDTIAGISLTPSTLTLTNGSTFTFTSAVGNFTGTSNVTVLSLITGIGAIAVASGTFTPLGALAGAGDPNEFEMTITINQNGTNNYSGTFTLSAPQGTGSSIPEPMTVALFGLGLAGLGVAARRRV